MGNRISEGPRTVVDFAGMSSPAVVYALLSAALFGLSTPAAKALLGSTDGMFLAGLLYCGAGAGVALSRRTARLLLPSAAEKESPLSGAEIPWLGGAIVAGGVVGPVLLMVGLTHTEASAASLMLTLEGVATALLAWFVFHEHFDRRIAIGMACLVTGAAILSWSGRPTWSGLLGPLSIAGACLAWGIDNNLTRKVSLSDPLQIVELKGLIAGPVNVALALWAGSSIPALAAIVGAAVVGFLGYGVSLALFVRALRDLGAARTGAYFSTAPFFGAAAAVLALGEPITARLAAAAGLMGLGVWLHVTERHEHAHVHEAQAHAHAHSHDEHHRHEHGPDAPPGEPHSHWHRHATLAHSHAHAPDAHHQHRH
jgi:drug/metabolite transporter (DMT)-like permease